MDGNDSIGMLLGKLYTGITTPVLYYQLDGLTFVVNVSCMFCELLCAQLVFFGAVSTDASICNLWMVAHENW